MIIGILGAAGVGKSTSSELLVDILGVEDTKVMSVAAPIKAMLLSIGLQPDDFKPRSKDRKIGWINSSPRLLMQSLGDWGRSVNQSLWLSILEQRMVAANVGGTRHIIIDDVRLPMEAATLRRHGGMLIRIDKTGRSPGSHITERASELIDVDFTIMNDGSIDTLRRSLSDAIDDTLNPMSND